MEMCDVQWHEWSELMTREELLKAVHGLAGVLIQSEDVFDREIIEKAG